MLELGDVAVPLPGAGPVVVAAHIEVGLDEDGGGGIWWLRRRLNTMSPAIGAVISQDRANPCFESAPWSQLRLLHFGDAAVQPMSAFDSNQEEADAIHPGPWRKLIHKCVINLRIAKLIPRHAGDARSGQIERNPEKRRGGEGETGFPRCPTNQHHPQTE